MPLNAWALLTVAELRDHLTFAATGKDTQLEGIINDTTDEIERFCRRQIVYRGTPYVEYHSFGGQTNNELRPLEWPIISVTSVYEDTAWPRTYAGPSLLVVGTDYQIVKGERDIIRKVSAGSSSDTWATGLKTVKLTYTAGYATPSAVPLRIKLQAKRLAALYWREIDLKMQGISSQSDALGNFQRFGPAMITPDMADALGGEKRSLTALYETGEAA